MHNRTIPWVILSAFLGITALYPNFLVFAIFWEFILGILGYLDSGQQYSGYPIGIFLIYFVHGSGSIWENFHNYLFGLFLISTSTSTASIIPFNYLFGFLLIPSTLYSASNYPYPSTTSLASPYQFLFYLFGFIIITSGLRVRHLYFLFY